MDRLIPYSAEVYSYVLSGYREPLLPLEILVIVAVLGWAALPAVRRSAYAPVVVMLSLAALWTGLGIGFYWSAYAPVNWAGLYFGTAALGQATMFVAMALWMVAGRPGPVSLANGPALRGIIFMTVLMAIAMGPLIRLLLDSPPAVAHAVGVTPLATIAMSCAVLASAPWVRPWHLWMLLPIPTGLLAWEAVRAAALVIPADGLLITLSVACLIGGLTVSRQSPQRTP